MEYNSINEILEYSDFNRIDFENCNSININDERINNISKDLNTVIQNEAYFGKTEFVKNLIKYITDLKSILTSFSQVTTSKVFDKEKSDYKIIDTKSASNINSILEQIENLISSEFNIEIVTIQLCEGITIESLSTSCGKLDLSEFKDMPYRKAIEEYSTLITDKNRVYFKYGKNKVTIIRLGVSVIANVNMTPENIAGIILHEVGHSIGHFRIKVGVGSQRILETVNSTLNICRNLKGSSTVFKDTVPSVKGFIDSEKALAKHISDSVDKNKSYEEMNKDPVTKALGAGVIASGFFAAFNITKLIMLVKNVIIGIINWWKYIFSDNHNDSENIVKERIDAIKSLNVSNDFSDKARLERALRIQFAELVSEIITTILFTSKFITGSIIFNTKLAIVSPKSYYKRTYEFNADNVASVYGLSAQLSEAIEKIKKINGQDDALYNGVFKLTNKIPVINFLAQLPIFVLKGTVQLLEGYPSDTERVYKMISELKSQSNDKSINPKLRKYILQDIENLKKIADRMTDPMSNAKENKWSLAFVHLVMRCIIKLLDSVKSIKSAPNSFVQKMALFNVFKNSKDVTSDLNPSEEEMIMANEFIMESYEDYPEGIDVLDKEVKFESPMPDEFYADMQSITTEAYFGKNEISEYSIKAIKYLRVEFKKATGRKLNDKEKKNITDIAKKWGDKISNHFNLESISINFANIYNAYAMPLYIGTNAEVAIANKTQIVETPTGFKFSESDGINFITTLGVPLLLDPNLSDEAIAGIIFHEIGHGFQQYETESLKQQQAGVEYSCTISLLKEFIYSVATLNPLRAIQTLFWIVIGSFTSFGLKTPRKQLDEEERKKSEKELNEIEILKDGKVKGSEVYTESDITILDIPRLILMAIGGLLKLIASFLPAPFVSSLIMALCEDPLILFDLLARGAYYQRKKTDEFFADSFATKYGFGTNMSDTFYTWHKQRNDYGPPDVLFRAIFQFNIYWYLQLVYLLDDHPTDEARIKNIYKTIEKELLNNPNLPDKLRKDMEKQLADIQKTIDEINSPSDNAKNKRYGLAIIKLFAKIFRVVKSSSTSFKDYMAPINLKKSQLIEMTVSLYKSSPIVQKYFGVSSDEFETYFSNEKMLENEFLSDL